MTEQDGRPTLEKQLEQAGKPTADTDVRPTTENQIKSAEVRTVVPIEYSSELGFTPFDEFMLKALEDERLHKENVKTNPGSIFDRVRGMFRK